MEKHIFKILLSLFLVFGFALTGAAEPREDFERPPSKEQRERVRKRIETLKMWKLTKALDLDEKTSAQLFPLLNKYDRRRVEIEEALRSGMNELKESLREKREASLKNILEKLEENHRAMQRINDEERGELKKILTIEQQARFIVFHQEFEQEIKRIIAEARGRHSEGPGKDLPERPPFPRR